MTEAFPLYWPEGWPRTKNRQTSRFNPYGLAAESRCILDELKLLGATDAIISTNIPLRRDGLPYSNQKIDDPGVAVYFNLNGEKQCIPCDRWWTVEENARAIWKSINALRGLERWGAKSFVSAAFRGFKALPNPTSKTPWRDVLGDCGNLDEAKSKFRELARKDHPDHGGNAKQMVRLNQALADARLEFQNPNP